MEQNCHLRGSLQGPLWDKAVTHGGIFKVHYGTKLSLTGVPSRSLMRQNCSGWGSLQPFRCLDMYPQNDFQPTLHAWKRNLYFWELYEDDIPNELPVYEAALAIAIKIVCLIGPSTIIFAISTRVDWNRCGVSFQCAFLSKAEILYTHIQHEQTQTKTNKQPYLHKAEYLTPLKESMQGSTAVSPARVSGIQEAPSHIGGHTA